MSLITTIFTYYTLYFITSPIIAPNYEAYMPKRTGPTKERTSSGFITERKESEKDLSIKTQDQKWREG